MRASSTASGFPWMTCSTLAAITPNKSANEVATALVNGSKLADPAVRKQLLEGGQATVDASTDPMIVLARKLDPMRRELIKWAQDNVESAEQQAGEQLGHGGAGPIIGARRNAR